MHEFSHVHGLPALSEHDMSAMTLAAHTTITAATMARRFMLGKVQVDSRELPSRPVRCSERKLCCRELCAIHSVIGSLNMATILALYVGTQVPLAQ